MDYIVRTMIEADAIQISKWKYEEPYSLYDMEYSKEFIKEFLDGSFFVVKNEDEEIIGYFCFGLSAQVPEGNKYRVYDEKDIIDIGLGMNPKYTGQGKGIEFLEKGIELAKEKFLISKVRLTVADFNKRAIKTYDRLGFKKEHIFEMKRENKTIKFITMKYEN
ncbi:GNAT family N-acetyltransferase [Clostridium sp. D2Q-11]|uniref:GNAT family N-acetyltransferase n=1 Tax=Anaeromonas frigoriresistens TaxID=2683708 RepID=A0A942UVD0_9FIRM|nr:GNAT family protein [Anaeromonas frigoriresistens]MBS4537499.1 GNAT family N-acetyltransferase [Anaeromonas frigoriresistens]